MFDLMRHRDDPNRLMTELEKFIVFWFGHRQPEYGVSEEKLRDLRLPTPLKRLYAFAGEWPGGHYDSVFSQDNYLFPIEWITTQDEKLVFARQPDGGWDCGTELEGDDPPVWVCWEGRPWIRMCDSLSQFLVTFCLLETIYSCDYRKTTDSDLASLVDQQSFFVVPLWIDGPFPKFSDDRTNHACPMQRVSFQLVQSQVLTSSLFDVAGTNSPHWHEEHPNYFRKSYRLEEEEKPSTTMDRDVAITSSHVPVLVKKQLIEMSIRKHQRQADHHSERAAFCRGLLLDVQRELREARE